MSKDVIEKKGLTKTNLRTEQEKRLISYAEKLACNAKQIKQGIQGAEVDPS